MDNPFQRGDRVRATVDIIGTNRIFKAGSTGTVAKRWPFTVAILPDGKKRTIETGNLKGLEKV